MLEGSLFLKQLLVAVIAVGLSACAKAPSSITPPVAVSISPANGSGPALNFVALYSDAKGAANIKLAGVLINDALTGANSCYLIYLPPFKSINLVKDEGAGSLQLDLDGHSKVDNSQCTVYAKGTSVVANGNDLTVKGSVTFKPEFGGAKKIYLYAENLQDGKSPMVPPQGAWMVP